MCCACDRSARRQFRPLFAVFRGRPRRQVGWQPADDQARDHRRPRGPARGTRRVAARARDGGRRHRGQRGRRHRPRRARRARRRDRRHPPARRQRHRAHARAARAAPRARGDPLHGRRRRRAALQRAGLRRARLRAEGGLDARSSSARSRRSWPAARTSTRGWTASCSRRARRPRSPALAARARDHAPHGRGRHGRGDRRPRSACRWRPCAPTCATSSASSRRATASTPSRSRSSAARSRSTHRRRLAEPWPATSCRRSCTTCARR